MTLTLFAAIVHCYVGCNSGSPDRQALHVLECDTETGAAKIVQSVTNLQGTTYFEFDDDGRYLYTAIGEETNGRKIGSLVRFALKGWRLDEMERLTELPCEAPCYVSLTPDGSRVAFAAYTSATAGTVTTEPSPVTRTTTGAATLRTYVFPDDAMGPNAKRQKKAYAHQTFYVPSSLVPHSSSLLGVVDLGCDRIRFFDPETMKVAPVADITFDAGEGPRHVIWSKDGKFLFALCELSSRVYSFALTQRSQPSQHSQPLNFCFRRVGAWTMLPPEADRRGADNSSDGTKASAIKLTADGKILMASNRGHDSIAFFDVDAATGTLKLRNVAKLTGKFPRDFELMPCEKFMVVGHKMSDEIQVYRFDRAACTLTPVGAPIPAWRPLCFKFSPAEDPLTAFVQKRILPFGADAVATSRFVEREIDAVDTACDEKWRTLKSKAEYDAYRLDLRKKMLAAVGTFPERTPLNARTTATLKRDGYTLEKVVFESMPGLFVTANLFIPDGSGRRPAVVMSCGHAETGKDSDVYRRACVIAVKRGFVALMFDPHNQGERRWTGQLNLCNSHTQNGLRGELLDWSPSLLRIWDGMRAIDYALSRPEVDPDRLGYMGQSGGGTMTALMEAADDRIKAACPSCYLTSLRALCQKMGPQDGEQNIFGQLAFGLNHTGYVLIPDIPVAVTCKYGDMFPFYGVRTLFDTVRAVERNVGLGERAFLNVAPGPHGWTEATETSSVLFLAQRLMPDCRDLKIDLSEIWSLDVGFDITKVDLARLPEDPTCTPEGSTEKMGSRHICDVIADRFAAAASARAALDLSAKRALATKLAKVRRPADANRRVKEIFAGDVDGRTVARLVVQDAKDGSMLPAAFVAGAADRDPVLVAAFGGRAQGLRLARPYLEAGHPVLVADVSGVGEVGREMFTFYGAQDRPDEGLGAMCYLLGEPLVGRRATDLLVWADVLAKRCGGRRPLLLASGPLAIPAAHAVAADAAAWSGVTFANGPKSWSEVLSAGAKGTNVLLRYADVVPRAALGYDWPELIAK